MLRSLGLLAQGVGVLQGTFETLTLTEVLGLLARSNKSGALLLEAGPATGVVHVDAGRCFAAESSEQRGPVESAPALLARLVDVCFAVSRQEGGSFRFASGEKPEWSSEPVDLDVAIEELEHLLDEWREIQEVVPSLDCRVRLSEELTVDQLPVDRQRWKLLVAIDGRRTVRDLVQRTGRPVLDTCHELVALVEAGAVGVVEPPATARAATRRREAASATGESTAAAASSSKALLQQEEPYGPGVEEPHLGPGPAAVNEDGSPADKGEFLRVFSALRDA